MAGQLGTFSPLLLHVNHVKVDRPWGAQRPGAALGGAEWRPSRKPVCSWEPAVHQARWPEPLQ